MKQRINSAIYRSASKHKVLATAMLAIGVFGVLVEPAAARLSANHNETLVNDAA